LKKERKIIKQEIRMYNDQIENNLLLGILHNMYGVHPISSQICGTEKSIENITVETLYRAFDNFYHPKNMYLLVIGRIDIHKLIELVEIKQKNSQKYTKTYSKKLLVNSPKKKQLYPIKMDITQEYFIIGFKGNKSLPEDYLQIYKYKVSIQLLLEILLGQFSTSVEILNHSRMITQNLVFDFCLDEPFHFATILSSSKDANKVVDYLYNIFITFDKNSDLNELSLNLAKKKLLGNFLSAQNSLDELCIKFQDNLYGEYTYLDMASIIELINLQDLISWGKTLFTPDNFNTFYIYPLH
jgi:predicted Zn-dependent peptidase